MFYKYLFNYARSQKEFFIHKAKGGAQPNISQDTIKSHPIPLPPFAEQQQIVNRIESLFATLDEAKEKVQTVVDGFEDRKAAILHKAFTGELTEEWRKNKHFTPQTRTLGEVRTGYSNFSEGDVVFAKITPCMENGKSAVIGQLVNGIGFGTTEYYVLRCSDRLYNRFLWHLIRGRSFRYEAKAVMTGAVGQQRVPKSFLENYPITLPAIEEQHEIVRILDDCFEKELQVKEIAEQVIDQIDVMKKSILARAFRGELGTNDPTDENAVELLKRIL